MRQTFLLILFFCATLHPFAQETIHFGKLGGEGELLFPRQVEEGPDGNIYIYDQMDAFIKIFNGEGTFLRKIGGQGQGPGEIQRADGVFFGFLTDGKLFFTEHFNGHPWITIMELTGDLDRILRIEIKERFGVQRAAALPEDQFLVQLAYIGIPDQKKDYFLHKFPQEIILLDAEGRVRSKLLRREPYTHISLLDQGGDSPLPFTPGFLWGLYDQRSIVFSEGLSTQLQIMDFKGTPLKNIETGLPKPQKVTKNDLEEWKRRRKEMMEARNPDWYNRLGKVIEMYKKSIYELRPNITGMDMTPDGNILLSGLQDSVRRTQTYWLIDARGRELARVETAVMIGKLSKNFLVYASIDDDGVVSLFGLRRSGTEKDDLQKIPQVDRSHPYPER